MSVSEVFKNLSPVFLWYLADFAKQLEVRAKFAQVYGPHARGGGVKIEEGKEYSWYIIKNYSKIVSIRTYIPKIADFFLNTLFGYFLRGKKY